LTLVLSRNSYLFAEANVDVYQNINGSYFHEEEYFCPPGFSQSNDQKNCFYTEKRATPRREASFMCEMYGSILANPYEDSKNYNLLQHLKQTLPPVSWSYDAIWQGPYIGLIRQRDYVGSLPGQKAWVWSNAEKDKYSEDDYDDDDYDEAPSILLPVDYNNWQYGAGNPSHPYKCVIINKNGKWVNVPCDGRRPYVCSTAAVEESPDYVTFETDHPYELDERLETVFKLPDNRCYDIWFDPRSSTASPRHRVIIKAYQGSTMRKRVFRFDDFGVARLNNVDYLDITFVSFSGTDAPVEPTWGVKMHIGPCQNLQTSTLY